MIEKIITAVENVVDEKKIEIKNLLAGSAESEMESFENKNRIGTLLVSVLLISLVVFVLLLLLSKYLWNNVLTKCVTIVKPIDSFTQFLGLYVLIYLLFNR